MDHTHSWGADLVTPDEDHGGMEAMESFTAELTPFTQSIPHSFTQCKSGKASPAFFNPVNIVIENGIYYVTVFVCCTDGNEQLNQKLAIWLGSLKETDHIKLTVSATVTNIPYEWLLTVMGALANTKAKIEILLNQIVIDGLAYFYLLADKVTVLEGGALFIPSYVTHRAKDTSIPWKAIHDFYQWIVEDAVIHGRLTKEEADLLADGQHVIPSLDRF